MFLLTIFLQIIYFRRLLLTDISGHYSLQIFLQVYSNIFQGTITENLFKEMEQEISNFMNARRWTEDDFNPEERIKCTIQISITEINASSNRLSEQRLRVVLLV